MTNTADIHTVHSAGELTFTESEIEPNRFAIQASGNWLMSITHNGEQVELRQRANLRRLVACWNAFEGVSTETIESEGKAASKRKALPDEQIGQDPIFRAGVRFAEAAHYIKEQSYARDTLKQALEAHRMLRNWIKAVPQEVVLPAMPGIDGDWLDEVERNLRAALEQQADPVYKDSTSHLHVGDSAFESWFQAQPFATQIGIKQISRDSYAAGMGDPLVVAAPQQQGEPAIPAHLDVRKILLAVTPGDGSGLEVYAKSVNDVVDTLTKLDERLEQLEFENPPIATEQGVIIIEMDCGAIQSTISKGVTASFVIIDRAAEFADEDSIVQIDGERVSVHRYSANGGDDDEVNRLLGQLDNDPTGRSSAS